MLLFLYDIGIVVSDIDSRLYAKVFQFTAVQGFPVFIMERGHIVVAVYCPPGVRETQGVQGFSGCPVLLLQF